MTHKTGYLSGPEPEENEKKTTAQLEDEKRPSSITISTNMYNDAEIGDHPSIEQHFKQNEIRATAHTGKYFTIDENFKEAIHQREKIEHEERMKARAKAAKEEQERQQIRNQEIAEIIQESQTLDPKEIKDEQAKTARTENLEKLYPDPIPTTNDVEDALWRKRTDKGAQIAGRAKLDDIYDSKLHSSIIQSFIFGFLGLGLQTVSEYCKSIFPPALITVASLASYIAYIYSFSSLSKGSQKYHKSKIPFDQEGTFTLATIFPFMALRIIIMNIFGNLPLIGGIIGTLLGVLIGSSLHYSYLYRFQIKADNKTILLNTSFYIFIGVLPDIIAFLSSRSSGSMEMAYVYSWATQIGIFYIGESFAAKLAPGHFGI